MNGHPLTAVVADDEQLAREELCFLLGQLEGVEVVGQASNGQDTSIARTFSITLTPQSDAPTGIALSSTIVRENAATNTMRATHTAPATTTTLWVTRRSWRLHRSRCGATVAVPSTPSDLTSTGEH